MKMQESRPSCSRWMNESFVGTDGDDDEDDDHYGNLDSVSADTPADSEINTPGPYSVTSFPPSVGTYDDALMTPHMYAPTSPVCVTPPNSPDSRVSIPAKKALLLSDQVPHPQTGSHRGSLEHGSNIFGRGGTQKAVFTRQNVTLSTLEKQSNNIFVEDSVGFCRPEKTETGWRAQESPTANIGQALGPEERRMSLEEFFTNLCNDKITWDELQNSLEEDDLNRNVENPNNLMNVDMSAQYKSTNGARKRTAGESIFSNPDFPDLDSEIPVKRQMLISSQNSLSPNFQDVKVNNLDSCVDGSSVYNCDSRRQESSAGAQNPAYNTSPGSMAKLRHYSSTDTGQFGQTVQEPQPPSLADSTSTMVDHNGNLVHTESQTPDNHISPWFVGPNPNPNQKYTFATCNEEICLQTQHPTTTSRMLPTQPYTPTFVMPETRQDQLHLPAMLTTHPPQQIIDKLPDDHTDTVRSTIVHSDSENQNFIVAIRNILQEIPSNLLAVTPYISHPDETACSGEATSSASIPTSSHDTVSFNGIYQLQDLIREPHLFHTSAGTDPPLPLDTDGSDISWLPADAVTAQVFTNNSTDNTSLYQTQTFHSTPAVLDNNPVIYGNDVMVSGLVDTSPSNSLFGTSTSVFGYDQTDLLEEQQECPSIDQRTDHQESSSLVELVQESSSLVELIQESSSLDELIQESPSLDGLVQESSSFDENPIYGNIHIPAEVPNNVDRINGSTSQPYDWQDIPAADLARSALQAHYLPCHSLYGGRNTHLGIDYLTGTNLDVVSDFKIPLDQPDCFEVIQKSALVDQTGESTPPDFRTSPVGDIRGSVLLHPVLEVESPSTSVNMPDVTDVGVPRKLKKTGQRIVDVKLELKSAILNKRQKEGKAAIEISFQPETHHELTVEEQEKDKRRKELNKKAAAKNRQKKKTIKQSQDQQYIEELKKNSELKKIIAQLEEQINSYTQLFQ